MENVSLIVPAFIAGLLMFLAPCTLPLVPGYLGFLSGVSTGEAAARSLRRRVFLNGLAYVLGFSIIFIALGTLFAAAGIALGAYRAALIRIGGVFIVIFGLSMVGAFKLPFASESRISLARFVKPGTLTSSFLFGAFFALGWTPCVGPVLGTVLTLAATVDTVGRGAFLLSIFALGLGIPFLLIALALGSAAAYIEKIMPYLRVASIIGGVFLIFIGFLLATNNFGFWVGISYRWFNVIDFDTLLERL